MKRSQEQIILVQSIKNPSITRRMTVTSARLNKSYWQVIDGGLSIAQAGTEQQAVDIVNPHGTYNVAAIIPVHGRLPLVTQTIKRLWSKNNINWIVCVCSTQQEADYLYREKWMLSGFNAFVHPNNPLSSKWNAGFKASKEYNPDACLFVGSSDWLSDNWISTLLPLMKDYDMVGMPGCHFLDISKNGMKAVNWGGYIGERSNESIGIGRLLSARILNKLNWEPFSQHKDGSLDYDMFLRVSKAGGKCAMVRHKDLIALSISTDQWENKHKFKDHETGELRHNSIRIKDIKTFLDKFPEAYKVFK